MAECLLTQAGLPRQAWRMSPTLPLPLEEGVAEGVNALRFALCALRSALCAMLYAVFTLQEKKG
jgi:hypothetical protein